MVTEAPYVGSSGRNKRGRCVDGDGSGDVASLPLSSGNAQHDLRFGKYRYRHDIGNTHTRTPACAVRSTLGALDVCRVRKFSPPNRRMPELEDEVALRGNLSDRE
jgi:hypothetical protein